MPMCIYCKKNKRDFDNREHVIPQAFGRFYPDNFVLNDKNKKDKSVCDDCNKNFGREFEDFLATESYEGYIQRSKFLEREPRDRTRNNIIIKVSEGDYKGIYVKLNKDNKVSPLPQIGLKRKNGIWDYFLLDKVNSVDKSLYDLSKSNLCAFCLDENTTKEIF